MDIVITLPQTLWKKIISGEKSIELRKNFPQVFDVNTDKVYVILKGTKLIGGYFQVRCFERFNAENVSAFDSILDEISVPKQWVVNYVGNKSYVYLWRIGDVVEFVHPIGKRPNWIFQNNPQSFVYLR